MSKMQRRHLNLIRGQCAGVPFDCFGSCCVLPFRVIFLLLFAPYDEGDASLVRKLPILPPFREARRAKREKVHYSAWVQVDSSRAPIECLIKDMSDSGARLELPPVIRSLPFRFALWLDREGKVQRTCEVVWRRAYSVGVRFAARN